MGLMSRRTVSILIVLACAALLIAAGMFATNEAQNRKSPRGARASESANGIQRAA